MIKIHPRSWDPVWELRVQQLSVMLSVLSVLLRLGCAGLRRTVEALLGSARRFVHVSVVTVAVLCLLAIVSTQLFMGDLRNKCVWAPPGLDSNQTSTPGYDYNTGFYSNDNNNNSHNEYYKHVTNPGNHFRRPGHLDPLLCGNRTTAGSCPDGFLCLRVGDNPNYGYTSYDSFFWSLLSAFRFLTQDYWENLMQMTLRAAGAEYVLFLVLAVFPTCFLVLSLLLAVVVMVIVDQDKATIDRKKLREEQFRRIEEALMRMKKEEEKDVGGVVLPSEGSTVTVAMTEADVDSTLSSHWQRLRLWLRLFVLSPLFDLGVILCLVVNTVVMAMEGYPMTEQFELVSSGLHLVFSFIFVVEMLLRMSVLGLRGFFQVSWHILDFLVVISFLLEFSLAHVSGVSMLRCLRLLRMFRLARWWPSLQLFLQVVWSSAQSLALVLLVLVFLWTVVGLQLFGTDYVTNVCRIADDCELPRWHMADLSHAVMLVFRVLYGEWIETLWDCMAVSGPGTCVAYFIPILVIGKLLVLFLFLNLFLNSTTNEKLAALEGKTDPRISKVTQICRRAGQTHQPDHRTEGHEEESLSLTPMTSESAQVHKVTESPDEDPKKPPTDPGQNRDEENHKELIVEDCCCSFCPLQDGDTSRGSWSDFRRICLLIVENRVFKGFMLFIILLSCMALSFEDVHLEDRRVLSLVLDWADLVFTLVFLVEMVLKWSGFGFRKYFSDVCCWLDFLVLDVSLLALVLEAAGVYCRPLRALRTLRTLSRFQGVRVVLRCLWAALPSLVDVQLVVLFVWLAFGILGVNLFAGKFFYCFNETSQEIFIPDAVNNRSDCLALIDAQFNEIRWKRFLLHFDNVHASYVSMLILGTSRGLFDLLYAATDSRGVELQPAFEHSLYMSLYFLGFMIFGGFFSFQLFIRVFLRALQQHGPQISLHPHAPLPLLFIPTLLFLSSSSPHSSSSPLHPHAPLPLLFIPTLLFLSSSSPRSSSSPLHPHTPLPLLFIPTLLFLSSSSPHSSSSPLHPHAPLPLLFIPTLLFLSSSSPRSSSSPLHPHAPLPLLFIPTLLFLSSSSPHSSSSPLHPHAPLPLLFIPTLLFLSSSSPRSSSSPLHPHTPLPLLFLLEELSTPLPPGI
uniref:Ion transport domain-containing protein n=1 Tax=Salarias fasciatus TaxID=181472 RepID=A0A672GF31_SALFA